MKTDRKPFEVRKRTRMRQEKGQELVMGEHEYEQHALVNITMKFITFYTNYKQVKKKQHH